VLLLLLMMMMMVLLVLLLVLLVCERGKGESQRHRASGEDAEDESAQVGRTSYCWVGVWWSSQKERGGGGGGGRGRCIGGEGRPHFFTGCGSRRGGRPV